MDNEITIEDIINGISIKLNSCFGDGFTIYTDEIPQGFAKPSFGVMFLSLTQSRRIDGRWFVSALFDISYFTDKGRVDASSQALKTQWAMKDITLVNGNRILGKEFNSEVVDGVGHNMVNFDFFLQEQQAFDYMETLEHFQTVRG